MKSCQRLYGIFLATIIALGGCGRDNGQTLQIKGQGEDDQKGEYLAFNSTVNANTNSDDFLPFDTVRFQDEDVFKKLNDKTVEVLSAGRYRITYEVSYKSNFNDRVNLRNWLQIEGSEIPASQSYCYTRNTNARHCSNAATTLIKIKQNEKVKVGMASASDSTFGDNIDVDVITDHSWILIEPLN